MKEKFLKKFRLRKKKEFIRVIHQHLSLKGNYMLVDYCFSKATNPKLGISVSTKYGSSPERNLFKRRLREAFRKNLSSYPHNLEINVRPLPQAKEATFLQIEKDLNDLISALKNDKLKSCQ